MSRVPAAAECYFAELVADVPVGLLSVRLEELNHFASIAVNRAVCLVINHEVKKERRELLTVAAVIYGATSRTLHECGYFPLPNENSNQRELLAPHLEHLIFPC